jgi:hypothetical protein
MERKEEFIRATVQVDRKKWERFRKIAKMRHSDASKEIRKFVDRYLAENAQLELKS